MKASKIQRLIQLVLIPIIILILFSPLYMYFSHDVSSLEHKYPHDRNAGVGEPDYVLKEGRPKDWVKIGAISRYAKFAIILSEDWSFYSHEGIDTEQMKVAVNEMISENRFRGASTITQQMVKNVFLSSDRTVWRKLHEIILAQKVERSLSKDKILEAYLNCIEFGPGIYGIKKASLHYFNKLPSSINPKEAAFLAMLLPSPKRYYISFKNKRLTPFARERIKVILIKMRMGKVITPEQYEAELKQPLGWE